MHASYLVGPPAALASGPDAEADGPCGPIASAGAGPDAAGPPADGPDAGLGVWSGGGLVAIVRRSGGRTVEVVRVAGAD